MKIDEGCINHNAVKLIAELVGCIYEFDYDTANAPYAAMTLAEIKGICDMVEELKEVLKA